MNAKLSRSTKVEVVLRPVRFRGRAYGIGSVIDAGDINTRGALLSNGCTVVEDDTPVKDVEVGVSPNMKSVKKKAAPKKRGRKPKTEKVEEDSDPGEFTG